jgi:hypothetical protein
MPKAIFVKVHINVAKVQNHELKHSRKETNTSLTTLY